LGECRMLVLGEERRDVEEVEKLLDIGAIILTQNREKIHLKASMQLSICGE